MLCPGTRVVTSVEVHRYDDFIVPAGRRGTVSESSPGLISVHMDLPIPGCEEWDNHVHCYDMEQFDAEFRPS